jgi:hypothetical protein
MKMSELNALLLIVLIMVGFPAIGIYGVRFGCKICAGFVPSIKETAIAIGLFCLAYIPLSIINSVPAIKTNWTAQLLLFVAGLSPLCFYPWSKAEAPGWLFDWFQERHSRFVGLVRVWDCRVCCRNRRFFRSFYALWRYVFNA